MSAKNTKNKTTEKAKKCDKCCSKMRSNGSARDCN